MQEGDRVEIDQPLVEVTTDKVDAEIPAPVSGVVEKILVLEGETIEVGARLVLIDDRAAAGPSPTTAKARDPRGSTLPRDPELAQKAPPVARRLADEADSNHGAISGTTAMRSRKGIASSR